MSEFHRAMMEAATVAEALAEKPYAECECLGLTDPETGMRECSIDVQGGDCLCDVHAETAREIAAAIRVHANKQAADAAGSAASATASASEVRDAVASLAK